MNVKEREVGDRARLLKRARKEKDAEQKDRLLVALHAIDGVPTEAIQRMLARSRGFVQRWAYVYRDGGIAALRDKPRGGSAPKLPREKEAALRARLEAGPREEDGVCVLRGRDVQRITREELGTPLSLSSVYRTLHRLGYSCLVPRPRHEKQDLEAQRKFQEERAPLL